MQRHDPTDQLVRKAHERSPGAPAGFAGRLHARISAEQTRLRRTRVIYIQSALAAAAVLILALTIGLNPQWFVPANDNEEPQPQAKSQPDQPLPKANAPVQGKPEPQPKPDNSAEPVPEPELPQIQPEPTSEPAPEPKKPDDSVEQPQPEPEPKKPEGAVEEPRPEPKQPDDVVKQPREPEGTEPVPENQGFRSARVDVVGEPKMRFKYNDAEWREYDGSKLREGAMLKAGTSPVELTLDGGGIARFNGELRLTLEEDALCFVLVDDSLYVDNLETQNPVRVVGKDHAAEMTSGAGVFYVSRQALEAACLAGEVKLDDVQVPVGFSIRANKDGPGEASKFKGDSFLKNLPERILVREDFDEAPPGGMYDEGERLENGVALCDTQPGYIAFRHNPTLMVLPGTVVRMRIRTTGVNRLELELFDSEITPLKRNKQRMFKHTWTPEKNGDWIEVELHVEEIPDNDDPEQFPTYGTLLRNFKLHFTGKKLEIDWVEFVRVQE
jgi:hypothetical protein